MALDEAGVCNQALARLGIKTYVDDLETDQTEEAETCNVFYADVRDACLSTFKWPFATRRATLAQDGDEPARVGWLYVFRAPSDCLVARAMWPITATTDPALDDLYGPQGQALTTAYLRTPRRDQMVSYAIEKATTGDHKVILCDVLAPVLFYTARVEDPVQFPSLFTSALAWKLAAEMAMPLTQDKQKAAYCREMYRQEIHEAYAIALNEQQEDEPPTTESIAVRY